MRGSSQASMWGKNISGRETQCQWPWGRRMFPCSENKLLGLETWPGASVQVMLGFSSVRQQPVESDVSHVLPPCFQGEIFISSAALRY